MSEQTTTAQTPTDQGRPTFTGVIPYLMVRGAAEAIEFYKRAFGAEELGPRMPAGENDPRLMHAYLKVNGSDIFLSDEFPEYGQSLGEGPKGITLHMAVDDADKWYNRAIEAGCTVEMEIADQFWGDRYGAVRDPFGHSWSMGTPLKQ
jgi:PhnB protein